MQKYLQFAHPMDATSADEDLCVVLDRSGTMSPGTTSSRTGWPVPKQAFCELLSVKRQHHPDDPGGSRGLRFQRRDRVPPDHDPIRVPVARRPRERATDPGLHEHHGRPQEGRAGAHERIQSGHLGHAKSVRVGQPGAGGVRSAVPDAHDEPNPQDSAARGRGTTTPGPDRSP